jgi:hypothetical protein
MPDVIKAIQDPKAGAAFAAAFVGGYLAPAFGARSKTEIDLLVFTCLIDAGAIDPAGPIYDIARAMNITPTRVRTLIFNWQLRSTASGVDLGAQLVAALRKTRFGKDGTYLTFGVESPLLREEITARLKRKGVFADATFSREIVRLPVDAFVEFLDDLVDDSTKTQLRKILVADKQLPDHSFKALAIGVLSALGEKVVGTVADDVVKGAVDGVGDAIVKPAIERMGSFLSGLLSGDAAAAAGPLVHTDFKEA